MKDNKKEISICNISDFYKSDAIDFASYDNIRKLCSFIDGLKLSQRKLLFTIRDKFSKDYCKTETVSNICTAYTQYLHGSANLIGVASNMAQDFVGSNNFPLLKGNSGGFGTRINPTYAAGRYTKVMLSKISDVLFSKFDDKILEEQIFEGEKIEPKYFVPIFPVIFLNGSDGLSTGFSETIFPRNPLIVIDYISSFLRGKPFKKELVPWFNGFKGEVIKNEQTGIYESFGKIERINTTKYVITELPIGLEYQKFVEFLDKLIETNVIVDYDDKCDTKTDTILFEIKTTRQFSKQNEDIKSLVKTFKLSKTLPETLCFIDDKQSVKEFSSVEDILNEYINIRLKYYDIRKKYILGDIKMRLLILYSKFLFVKGICEETIIVNKQKKENIIKQLEKNEKIIKVDNSYDYLLRMQISSLTDEMLKEIKTQIAELKTKFTELKSTTIEDMWISELSELKREIKNYIKD